MKLIIQVLRSGSLANATLFGCDSRTFLIDAGGFTQKGLLETIRRCEVAPERLSGLFVSHFHVDHFDQRAAGVCARFGIPIYVHSANRHLLGRYGRPALERLVRVFDWRAFKLSPKLVVRPFPLPHDAEGTTAGFSITYSEKGRRCRISMATDLGRFDRSMLPYLTDSAVLLWEANHDTEMLWSCPRISEQTKRRIASDAGHLSNEQSGRALVEILSASRRVLPLRILLAHVSRDRNRPELAVGVVRRMLREAGFGNIAVGVAKREALTERHVLDLSCQPPRLRIEHCQASLPLE